MALPARICLFEQTPGSQLRYKKHLIVTKAWLLQINSSSDSDIPSCLKCSKSWPVLKNIKYDYFSSSYTRVIFKGIRKTGPRPDICKCLCHNSSNARNVCGLSRFWWNEVFLNCHLHHPKNVAISSLTMAEHIITRKYNGSVFTVQGYEEFNGERK